MTIAFAIEPQAERLSCYSCGMLIAYRERDGTVRIVVKGNERYQLDGAVAVDCPSCGRCVRIRPKKAA